MSKTLQETIGKVETGRVYITPDGDNCHFAAAPKKLRTLARKYPMGAIDYDADNCGEITISIDGHIWASSQAAMRTEYTGARCTYLPSRVWDYLSVAYGVATRTEEVMNYVTRQDAQAAIDALASYSPNMAHCPLSYRNNAQRSCDGLIAVSYRPCEEESGLYYAIPAAS
jgi:hypothetical protein